MAFPDPVVLDLPEPPSSNRYWRRHGNYLHRSHEADTYIAAVTQLAGPHRRNGGPRFPEGDISIIVVWHRSAKRGDLPNRTKVLYDALQGTIYSDDKQIAQEWTRRCDEHQSLRKGSVRVEITALP